MRTHFSVLPDMRHRSESFLTRRSTITLLILAFVLGAVFLTVKLAQISQELRQRAQVAVILSLTPDRTPINIGDEVNLALEMDTGSTQVSGVDITVNFDSAIFDAVSFTKTTGDGYFDQALQDGSLSGNTGHIALANDLSSLKTGKGSLAILKLRAKAASSGSSIGFISAQSYVLQVGNVYLTPNFVPGTVVVNGNQNASANADSTITILPASITVQLNETVSLPVHINTGSNQVTSANLYVKYDANILEAISISNGGFLPTTTGSAIGNGSAYILVNNGSSSKQGEGVLAVLQFKAKSVGTTTVTIDDSATTVTANGVNGDAQRYSLSSTVTVGQTAVTPTPGTGGVCYQATPAAPSNVQAISLNSSQVLLSWTGVANTTYYGISFGEKSGTYIYGAANVGNVTSYTVKNLKAGRRYYFAVYAVNDCAPSSYSYEVTAVPTSNVVYLTPTPVPSPFVYLYPTPTPNIYGTLPSPSTVVAPIVSPTAIPFVFPTPTPSPAASATLEGIKLFFYNFLWVIIAILVLLIIIMVLYRNTRRE